MQGSKYSDEIRERAIALCASPKMNPAKVAKEMGIPRATVYDWYRTAQESDPDYVAMRRAKIRSMMDKAYSVVGRSVDGLEKQSKVMRRESEQLDKILLKLEIDQGLDEKTRDQICEIVRHYTGTTMLDKVKIAKETLAIHDKLAKQLDGDEQDGVLQITFAGGEFDGVMD